MKGKLLLLLLLLPCLLQAQTGYLHANGTVYADNNGKQIQLKGTNLGCWLYFEPWMMNAGEFPNWLAASGTTDTFQTAVTNVVGAANAQTFWNTYRANMVTAPDIAKIASLGYNCVRVPMDYRLFYDDSTSTYLTSNYTYIDNLLTWCAKNKIYAILDMHTVPGGQDIRNSNSLYATPSAQTIVQTIWTNIASRYSTNPWLGGYDLINEPVVQGSSDLVTEYQSLTSAIRSVDQNHLVFVEGDWYASQLWLLGGPWDTNMSYSDHNYGSVLPNDLPAHEDQATLNNTPLWMGEFGYNSNTWNATQESELNTPTTLNGRTIQPSWTFWSWKAMSIWSPYKVTVPSAYQSLLNYWNGYGAQPTQAQAMTDLMALANAVTFSNCVQNKDVVDAYNRPTFLTSTAPYASLTIPGHIECVYYDMGPQGRAYNNKDYWNVGQGGVFNSWNNGWTFRNDGVDIVGSYGKTQSGYAIGWTGTGQWTMYTLNCTPGTYNVTIGYTGQGGKIQLLLNGTKITGNIVLPESPNNGTTYTTYVAPGVVVGATGTAKLQIYEETNGYNLGYVEFNPVTP